LLALSNTLAFVKIGERPFNQSINKFTLHSPLKVAQPIILKNIKFFNPFFQIIPIALALPMQMRSPPKLPILTLKVVFVSGVHFFTNLHNKTGHFVTFFSISPLFVKKVRHFVKKSTFFCRF